MSRFKVGDTIRLEDSTPDLVVAVFTPTVNGTRRNHYVLQDVKDQNMYVESEDELDGYVLFKDDTYYVIDSVTEGYKVVKISQATISEVAVFKGYAQAYQYIDLMNDKEGQL